MRLFNLPLTLFILEPLIAANRCLHYITIIILLFQINFCRAEISAGTGFFIGSNGYIATNHHVIEGADFVHVYTHDGLKHKAAVVRTDPSNDIAVLKINAKYTPLSVIRSDNVKRGAQVATLGYPLIAIQGLEPKLTQGIVNSLSGISDDPRLYQINAPIQSGNSGGALVDVMGNVIGIVSAKLGELYTLKETGDLPQNVNYAIKSNYLLEVMRSIKGIKESTTKSAKSKLELHVLGDMLEQSTCLIVATDTEQVDESAPLGDIQGDHKVFSTQPTLQRAQRAAQQLGCDIDLTEKLGEPNQQGDIYFFICKNEPVRLMQIACPLIPADGACHSVASLVIDMHEPKYHNNANKNFVIATYKGSQAKRRPPLSYLTDDHIRLNLGNNISKKLYADVLSADLVIAVFNRRVLLVGTAKDYYTKRVVNDMASRFENVKEVFDEIIVTNGYGEPTNSDERIRQILGIRVTNINAKLNSVVMPIVHHNKVYLMGNVLRSEGDAYAEIAAKTQGVEKVIKVFEYID